MVGEALEDEVEEEVQGELPKHHRCAAHTVNLLATADVSKVTFLPKNLNQWKILYKFEFFKKVFRFLIHNIKELIQNLNLLNSYNIF